MIEHLPLQMIELFIARKLSAQALRKAAQHIAVCESCREKINAAKPTDAAIEDLQKGFQTEFFEKTHLTYEQVAAFVDEALSVQEREIANHHLATCDECSKEIRELVLLKNNLETYPRLAKETAFFAATQTAAEANASSSAAKDAPAEAKISQSFWQTLFKLWQSKPLQITFATATVLIVVIAASLFVFRSANQPQKVESIDAKAKPSTNSSTEQATPSANQGNKNDAIAQQTQGNFNAKDSQTHQQEDAGDATRLNSGGENEAAKSAGAIADAATLPPAYEKIVRQALATQAIARPAVIQELVGRRSNLMSSKSEAESFAVLNPIGTVIRDARPTFRWQALSNAHAYTVFILDENFNVVMQSEPLTETSWTIPQSLKRGGVYIWQVTATKDDRELTSPAAPMPEARFKILEQAKADELQRLTEGRKNSHLILGAIFAHNGLLDEAESEFQMAIEANQDAVAAKKLLQSVKALRR